ncbi:lipopolysaccharide biosynthesis protein [Bacillus rhizoplanae]|uniref:lipopolysaccharide biosynthesis protein n=1 Tax=Bacillus rhizoplanae TaxID=2880966 RepID=UPI003D1FAC08
MNRTRKFFYNSISTALCQLIVMLAGFITPKIMLHYYGSEINGLVSSINQFVSYFYLVEMGLSAATVYALYKPLADNDHKAINGVVSAANKFYNQAGYIFVSLTLGLAIIYPMLVKTDTLTPLNIGILVLVLGVNGALEFFTLSKYRAIISADQRTYVISYATIAYIIINTTIIVILARLGVGIVLLQAIALLSIFLRSFILMIYVKIKYKYIDYKEVPNTLALNKRWDALYQQILGIIYKSSPVIILTLFVKDLTLVSIYTIFNIIMMGISGILEIFMSGLSASFGDVIARKEKSTLQRAFREFEFVYYGLITIIYAVSFVTIMPFIRIYTQGITDAVYDNSTIGFLMVLNGLLYNIKVPQGMLVISAGMYKETRKQVTIQACIILIGGIVLSVYWGIIGVLVAAILSNAYRDIDLLFFVPNKITGLPVKATIFRWINILCSLLIICVPFYFIEIEPGGYITWFLYAIMVAIYGVLVILFSGYIFERDEMKNITRRILSIIKVR